LMKAEVINSQLEPKSSLPTIELRSKRTA
jgi:hypothetical protein